MQRRTFLSLLALPAVAHLLQSCGDDSTQGGTGTTPGSAPTPTTSPGSGLRNTLRGTAAHVTEGADPTDAAAAVNAFANDLYARLVATDPLANLVFSPASIAVALAMTSTGAKGATLQEMDAVLHITDPAAIHRSMNGLMMGMEALNQSQDNTAEGGTGTSEVQLNIANSLWGQNGLAFEQAFLDLLSAEYDAGLELVDYANDPDGARGAINEWVATETKDRIPQLLAPGSISGDTRLTLVNAIYLKANWADVFDGDATKDEPFAAPAGEVTVQMMHRTSQFGYAEGEGWQAVDVPYVFGGLSFTVAVGDTADAVLPTGDEVFAGLSSRKVALGFPKFDIETSTDLASVLGDMGMATAFTADADFSGMTADERLTIGGVIHQANITVDEQGTEAAAATAVVMVATAAPVEQDPVVLTIDRPFTFWLRDRATDTIVFMGRVTDPSSTRT
ncbi:MAG: serpin family protein [Actinomycetota bacterium]|nr:serpin family protein [Actinomycetota bacterium]